MTTAAIARVRLGLRTLSAFFSRRERRGRPGMSLGYRTGSD